MQIKRPTLGTVDDLLHRAIERSHEADCDCGLARLIAQPCVSRLRFGSRMKLESQRSVPASNALASLAPRNGLNFTRIDLAQALSDL